MQVVRGAEEETIPNLLFACLSWSVSKGDADAKRAEDREDEREGGEGMSDDISQLGRYRADSEVGRLRAEIERLREVLRDTHTILDLGYDREEVKDYINKALAGEEKKL